MMACILLKFSTFCRFSFQAMRYNAVNIEFAASWISKYEVLLYSIFTSSTANNFWRQRATHCIIIILCAIDNNLFIFIFSSAFRKGCRSFVAPHHRWPTIQTDERQQVSKIDLDLYFLDSRDGAVVRALASHQCKPGSIPAWCHLWLVCCWLSPCSEGFSLDSSVSSILKKTTFPNSKPS